MAYSNKNIVITPNIGSTTEDPKIVFSGGDASTSTTVTLKTYPLSGGTLSFEGSAGQLFSITNDLSSTLFSVNDVSGIPSIEVDATGKVLLAQFGGFVGIGTGTPAAKLDISAGTVTTAVSALNLTQTWNNAATTFTATKLNVTDTASASGSLLIDYQVGGTSKFKVTKAGYVQLSTGLNLDPGSGISLWVLQGGESDGMRVLNSARNASAPLSASAMGVTSTGYFGFSSSTTLGAPIVAADTFLYRDAAATLAQRNSTNAQSLRIYNTYTDSSNYERAVIDWSTTANTLTIGAQAAGTGTLRSATLLASSVAINPNNANSILTIAANGYGPKLTGGADGIFFGSALVFTTARSTNFNGNTSAIGYNGIGLADFLSWDIVYRNSYPIDALPGTISIRGNNAYTSAATNLVGGSLYFAAGTGASASAGAAHGGNVYLDGGRGYGTGNHGTIVIGASYYRLLAFGGVTASTPGLKHSGTTLKVRLADDSADAPITALSASFSAGTVTSNSPALSVAQTWNEGSTSFKAIDVAVTNTASASTSYLISASVGGTTVFAVRRDGVITNATIDSSQVTGIGTIVTDAQAAATSASTSASSASTSAASAALSAASATSSATSASTSATNASNSASSASTSANSAAYSATLAARIRRFENTGTYLYCGLAPSGSADADSVWSIRRITITSAGTVSATQTATNVAWTNRASATYS